MRVPGPTEGIEADWSDTSMAAAAELTAERAVLDRLRTVRQAQIATIGRRAARLAEEAAEMSADGLRDIFDEDDDPDAAVQATLVREGAVHAMAAARRFQQVDAIGDAPAFGRITDEDGERLYVGRCSVIDGDEALLVDWRARAAIPFYRGTPLEPLGVVHRRHLHYDTDDASLLDSYSDEIFDASRLQEMSGLQGEAALLAALDRDTTGQMASVVATIQAEQDAVIRAPADKPLLVQGGPGTGKTVVALHRAAYLLYDQRQALAENGVLIVGPTSHFLAYISDVLPSLGETGVVSALPVDLYGGVLRGRNEPESVSRIKGRSEMVMLLTKAIRDRQRRPTTELLAWYGSDNVRLPVAEAQRCFDDARRSPSHNEGAERFRTLLIEALADKVYSRAFDNYGEAFRTFAASAAVRIYLLKHWPTLTPEQGLNDLFGSSALLRLAALGSGLARSEVAALGRDRVGEVDLPDARWSDADIPLLDELWSIVGGLPGSVADDDRQAVRDARDEFEIAAMKDALGEGDADDDDADQSAEELLEASPIDEEVLGMPAPPIRANRV